MCDGVEHRGGVLVGDLFPEEVACVEDDGPGVRHAIRDVRRIRERYDVVVAAGDNGDRDLQMREELGETGSSSG